MTVFKERSIGIWESVLVEDFANNPFIGKLFKSSNS